MIPSDIYSIIISLNWTFQIILLTHSNFSCKGLNHFQRYSTNIHFKTLHGRRHYGNLKTSRFKSNAAWRSSTIRWRLRGNFDVPRKPFWNINLRTRVWKFKFSFRSGNTCSHGVFVRLSENSSCYIHFVQYFVTHNEL